MTGRLEASIERGLNRRVEALRAGATDALVEVLQARRPDLAVEITVDVPQREARTCVWCRESLEGRRKDACYCHAACRAAASRARRNEGSEPASWFWSGVEPEKAVGSAHKRTPRTTTDVQKAGRSIVHAEAGAAGA